MKSTLNRLRSLWPHDDSPGFSDYSENDIRTHRWIARVLKLMGALVFFGGFMGMDRPLNLGATGAVLGTAAVFWVFATRMEMQALRWEVQLEQ